MGRPSTAPMPLFASAWGQGQILRPVRCDPLGHRPAACNGRGAGRDPWRPRAVGRLLLRKAHRGGSLRDDLPSLRQGSWVVRPGAEPDSPEFIEFRAAEPFDRRILAAAGNQLIRSFCPPNKLKEAENM